MVTYSTVGGALCLDFVNTASRRRTPPFREDLGSYEDLVDWACQMETLQAAEGSALKARAAADPAAAGSVLERARELREAVYRVFTAPFHNEEIRAGDLQRISEEYARAAAHRALAPSAGGGIDFEWRDADELDRPLWPIAVSAAVLVSSEDADRVKECATDNCNWIFFDASKNRSRKWCEMKECGNRAKARRHYHRRTARS